MIQLTCHQRANIYDLDLVLLSGNLQLWYKLLQ